MASVVTAIQMELTGIGAGWTTIGDVVRIVPIRVKYGIQGNTPRDRVASPGTLEFALDNSTNNSAAKLGYYSPAHADCRSGFGIGIGVRLALTFGGTTYYKWRGTIKKIRPLSGRYAERRVIVSCVDWMDDVATALIRGLPIQLNKRSDQIFTTLIEGTGVEGEWEGIRRQPAATSISEGIHSFPYVFDSLRDETALVLREFQRVANSELANIYLKGDTVQGGTLVYENGQERGKKTVNAIALEGLKLIAHSSQENVLNDVKVEVHPRRVDDAATTVLFNLEETPKIDINDDRSFDALYRDPNQRTDRVSGLDMVDPLVAGTDYKFNTQADDAGDNIISQLTVTVDFGGNSAKVKIINNGPLVGYLTKFQLRGKGLYAYDAVLSREQDLPSQYEYGHNSFGLDMPYQSVPAMAQKAASFIMHQNAAPYTRIESARFIANHSDALMTQALLREVGDRIGITDVVTGMSSGLVDIIKPLLSPLGETFMGPTPGQSLFGIHPEVHLNGRYIYLPCGQATTPHLAIIDVDDPENLVYSDLVATLPATFGNIQECQIVGNWLYVCDGDNHSIHIIDISTPGVPVYDSEWTDAAMWDPDQVAGKAGWLFVSDDGTATKGVRMIDISTPNAPVLDNTWTGTVWPRQLRLSHDGNILVVLDPETPQLFLVDVSDPTSPSTLATLNPDYANQFAQLWDVEFSGDDGWLYVTTTNGIVNQATVSVLDIRVPGSPVWVNKNATSLLDFDDEDDAVGIDSLTLQPEDKTLYVMGLSVDEPYVGSSTRGAACKVVNHEHVFRSIDYSPSGVVYKLGNHAYAMVRVPPYPSTYGVGIVLNPDGVIGAQVFKLRHTFQQSISHFINAVELTIDKDGIMTCSWLLAPSLAEQFWVLGVPGFSELGITTRLAWGEI